MASAGETIVSAQDWIRGITFSVIASMIGAASKLSIRKSWLLDAKRQHQVQQQQFVERHNHNLEVNTDVLRPMHSNQNKEKNHTPLVENGDQHPIPNRNQSQHRHQFLSISDPLLTFDPTRKNKDESIASKRLASLLYVLGMFGMTFLNPLFCVLAMQYANPSILAPFSGLTLVWIILFSGVVLNELPGTRQKIACALIVVGEVLVAFFGDHVNGIEGGIEAVISSYQDPAFHIYIVIMTLYLVQLGIFILHCPENSWQRKFSWGSVGGSITGFQNFLKDALTILDLWKSEGNNLFLPPEFFLFAILAILTSFIGLLCLSSCMKRFDATFSSAMFVVSFALSASFMSAVHYHTFQHLDGVINYIMYPSGLATLILGAFMLMKPKSRDDCQDTTCEDHHPWNESSSEIECLS